MAKAFVADNEVRNAAARHLLARILIYGVLTLFAVIYLVPLAVVIMNTQWNDCLPALILV
jgi:glucose/mannose transport system permease protein